MNEIMGPDELKDQKLIGKYQVVGKTINNCAEKVWVFRIC